jgi:MerR family transcriptional regulator/heat shock protein HspR
MMAAERYNIVLCRDERQQLTLDAVALCAGLHPALVESYVEVGLIEPVAWQGAALLFDASAIPRLRMIGRLREALGINVAGIAVILDLLDRLHALQRDNESLNSRL